LRPQGHRLGVCTNKLEWLSKRLLDQLGSAAVFAAICGADVWGPEARSDHFPGDRGAAGGDVKASIMVGDAGTDVGVARRAGVPVSGQFWLTDVRSPS